MGGAFLFVAASILYAMGNSQPAKVSNLTLGDVTESGREIAEELDTWQAWVALLLTLLAIEFGFALFAGLMWAPNKHGQFWAWNLLLLALLSVLLPALSMLAWRPTFDQLSMSEFLRDALYELELIVLLLYPVIGVAIAAPLLAAALIGATCRGPGHRPLLVGAMQGACYLSGFLVLFGLMVWIIVTIFSFLVGAFDLGPSTQTMFGIDTEAAIVMTFLGLFVAGGATYLALLWRITRATRYANW